ncbi:MAG: hypothetical protein WD267_10980 [Balneolales bacterium]
MPKIARYFLKAGLLHFLLAMGILVWLSWPNGNAPVGLRPAFYHVLMVGWISQVIFGVSLWMFPRFTKEKPRGFDLLSWFAFWTINAGLLLRLLFEPLLYQYDGSFAGYMIVFSAVLQWAGSLSYTVNIWNRVRGK